ncbi:DUF1269 domain-containing protein [Streptomyces sp. SP18CS02]|uniref:DUF1269 domain-containing protein n=1 Tax=Streptomyces sp. SP18CS02 TaxID=3002531 RepID=UPI002E77F586|nr:DUF1269 domain-containing protein [Streptomyces sp. SP18CS02]MEE1752849.1 DUF1269 domain-containing protein [Streptomyces sp. SP18CS02]
MSELIVIGYDGPSVAREAFKTVQRLDRESVVDLTGLAVVSVDQDGETHVDTPGKSEKTAKSATAGALWGLVFGMLILSPATGLVGAAIGGLFGKLSQMGVDATFREKVRSLLGPGSAAVVIMASRIADDEFTAAIGSYGGEVLKTSLAEQDEKDLAAQLAGSQ